MKKLPILIVAFAVLSLLGACKSGEAAKTASTPTITPSNKLAIAGSTTLLPVAQKAVEAFKKRQPEITVSLSGSGSLSGINGLKDGYADIAMSSRELSQEEKDKFNKRGIKTKETVVAWDGIIPFVHPSNPVKNLSLAQLKDIYTGKVTDWEQVGGKKGKIILVARDFTSGTHEDWAELVLNKDPVAANAVEQPTSEAVLEMVANSPNAIGYDGIGYVEGNSRVKMLSVDGKLASAGSILDKSYKVVRPLVMFTHENTTSAVVEFMNFMTSPEGQALVKEAKFVPIS